MNERLSTLATMFEKEQRRIEMQQANYDRYKARSVFYRGKSDDDRHNHEMLIKKMALIRLGVACNKCTTNQ